MYHNEEEAEEKRAKAEEEPGGDGDRSDAPDLSSIAADDTVSLYLMEMSHVPLLTHEEEVELAQWLERGQEAQRQLARNGPAPQKRARLKRLIAVPQK